MLPVLQAENLLLRRGDWSAELPQLRLLPGAAAALHGPSGSGKTSLLLAMFGLLPAGVVVRGRVEVSGRDFARLGAAERRAQLRGTIAWVAQDAHAALDPLQTVGAQLRQATGRSVGECAAALGSLGIAGPERLCARLPHEISGGEAQRVLLAVAILRRARLVVADEPTASLDDDSLGDLVEQLLLLREGGAALLLSTHDARLLERLDPELLVDRGGVFATGRAGRETWPQRRPEPDHDDAPVLSVSGLRVLRDGRPILDGVDLELRRAEVVALVGASGAGKTTLARVLAGHLPADAGVVRRPDRRQAVQLLFQDALSSLTPGRPLRSLLMEAQAPYFDAEVAAGQLSLPVEALDRTAAELSGGERRRAALLRVLAVNPDVLVLDEPTASLDGAAAVAVVSQLLSLRELRGTALLLITHDRGLAEAVADRVITLAEGRTWA